MPMPSSLYLDTCTLQCQTRLALIWTCCGATPGRAELLRCASIWLSRIDDLFYYIFLFFCCCCCCCGSVIGEHPSKNVHFQNGSSSRKTRFVPKMRGLLNPRKRGNTTRTMDFGRVRGRSRSRSAMLQRLAETPTTVKHRRNGLTSWCLQPLFGAWWAAKHLRAHP